MGTDTAVDEPAQVLERAVGWREWLCLPDLGAACIKAKVDTGARTSALHTEHYETYEKDGVLMVHLCSSWILRSNAPFKAGERIEIDAHAPVLNYRSVKDSGGHVEERPFISTTVASGKLRWDIELSLTKRTDMRFPMLLGRKALAKAGILVNSNASYLHGTSLPTL